MSKKSSQVMKRLMAFMLVLLMTCSSMAITAVADQVDGNDCTHENKVSYGVYEYCPDCGHAVDKDTKADCENPEYKVYKCLTCNEYVKVPNGDALEHTEYVLGPDGNPTTEKTDSKVSKEATCDADGEITYVCGRCGKNATKSIPKTGHQWVTDTSKGVDGFSGGELCTVPRIEYQKCEKCEAEREVKLPVETEHKMGEEVVKILERPTCAHDGLRSKVKYCLNPGCTYVEVVDNNNLFYPRMTDHQDILEKLLTHDEEKGETVYDRADDVMQACTDNVYPETTITKDDADAEPYPGIIEYKYGECYVEYQEATCTEDGYITLICCEDECGASYTVVLPAYGHSYYFEKENGSQHFSCTEDGSILVKCHKCDFVEQAYLQARHEHAWSEKPSSYKQQGVKIDNFDDIAECCDYVVCYDCGGYIETYKLSNGDEVEITIDCEETFEKKVDGDESKHVKGDHVVIIQAGNCGHDEIFLSNCTNCGKAFEGVEPATGKHDYKVETTQPSCGVEGMYHMVCKVCGHVNDATIPALSDKHKWIVNDETDENGWKTETEMVCDERHPVEGLATRECVICHTVETKAIPVKHTYNPDDPKVTYTKPTCTTEGSVSYECTACHKVITNEAIPALGHAWEREGYEGIEADNGKFYDSVENATCKHGNIYTRECPNCGLTGEKAETYDDENYAEHQMYHEKDGIVGLVIKQLPDCCHGGKATYECAVCHKAIDFDLDPLPHNYSINWNKDERQYEKTCVELASDNWDDLMADYMADSEIITDEEYREKIVEVLKKMLKEYEDEDGNVCVNGFGCGEVIEIPMNTTHYSVELKGEIVKIKLDDKCVALKNPMIRVTWSYSNANDEVFSYTRYVKADDDEYDIGEATAPKGYSLDCVMIIVVDQKGLTAAEAIGQGYGYEKY